MVSPSERWPSSRVSWKMRAAQSAGMRTRRPRPFTFACRSFEEEEEVERTEEFGLVGLEGSMSWLVAADGLEQEEEEEMNGLSETKLLLLLLLG